MRWKEATWIAFDLETTGKYPLEAEICEMAAVKWCGGEIVDTFQTLIKPSMTMSEEVIAIHHISNEMVAEAPIISEKIMAFREFIDDGYLIAHHAPFDMGFLSWEFEKARLSKPHRPVYCSSLLSRNLIRGVPNHRLATLASHFKIDAGAAHRALDDAKTCLMVAFECFKHAGEDSTLDHLIQKQTRTLNWSAFSIETLMEREVYRCLIRATLDHREVHMIYQGGSRPGQNRRVFPLGLVRSPDGDYLVATEGDEVQTKRYMLDKITGVKMVRDGEFFD